MEKDKRIAVSAATRETLKALRARMNATSEHNVTINEVIREAAALLVVELDRKDRNPRGQWVPFDNSPHAPIIAPDDEQIERR